MTNIGSRIVAGITGSVISSPFVAAGGALLGYVYGKLADLPAGEVAKAWAVWNVAESVITTLACTLTENKATQAIIKSTILIAGASIGIKELQKRGLIGDKLVIFIIVMRALAVLGILTNAAASTSEVGQV